MSVSRDESDQQCRDFMDAFPEFESLSFDDWLIENSDDLLSEDLLAGFEVLKRHPDYTGF